MGCIRGAGEGNRTLVISLEGFCSTIELHPPSVSKKDSFTTCFVRPPGRLSIGGGGWIRTNVGARPTDLQSAPFNRSGTPPGNSQLSTIPRDRANKTGASLHLSCREPPRKKRGSAAAQVGSRQAEEHQGKKGEHPLPERGNGQRLEDR